MLRHIGFRFVQLLFVMMIVSLVIFVLMKLAPGDPVLAILKANEGAVTISDQNAVRTELGLEMPLYKQFGSWLKGVVTFDLGRSYMNNRDVWDILMERLPATVSLTIGAFIVLLLISVPLGVLAAQHQGRLPDHISRFVALIGSSIPSFWLGLLLIYVFSYQLNWLPTMGKGSLSHLILPSITLGFVMAPEYIRLLRAGLLETLSEQYIRAARARGIAEWSIIMRHALQGALLPILSVFGMSIGSLMAGSVVTESLFGWPGLGSMAMEAITQRNYPLIQGYVLISGFFIVLANLAVDISYGLLDPRIRVGRGKRA
ncbi:nickel ABC transporter permease [Paenibacillus sp. L3-i20]|uniref:nickel ABC transporter permease n=1 Tax=Paenibacillus sp. L3-i20 TaxID=2905833 RepID=UPI001EDEAF6C|nr:nickel ABC transporter permease [Paenibacillus sp. L3-i20]GKU78819.1 nickel ABC transporter permease subunit NikB [Paenibacillus sp. L3-i20]